MKKTSSCVVTVVVCVTLAGSFSIAVGGGDVVSLRGSVPLNSESAVPPATEIIRARSRIPRTFAEQPPLVPHSLEEYEITLKENDCLGCHGVAGSGAPAVSPSHYLDRAGKHLPAVSARRYFCDQCHVPQRNAKPLVENSFTGAK